MKTVSYFLSLVWRNWYWKGLDKWHPFKWRISVKTAWDVAKIFTGKGELK